MRNIENLNETNGVLKAFNDKTNHPREVYYKSINMHPNSHNHLRNNFIKEPGKMVIDSYNQNYIEEWMTAIDSLSNEYPIQQKDSIKDKINDKFEINPEKLFTDQDQKYMRDQLNAQNGIKWEIFKFARLNLSKSDTATKISTPIFFKDHRLAMVFLSSPSYEGVEVYRRKNEGWEFYFGSTFLIE